MIDLDLGKCEPAPGSLYDDARSLPWRENLEAALAAAHSLMRSPTEHESNPLIASALSCLGCAKGLPEPDGTAGIALGFLTAHDCA
jgi:hypothetical protein